MQRGYFFGGSVKMPFWGNHHVPVDSGCRASTEIVGNLIFIVRRLLLDAAGVEMNNPRALDLVACMAEVGGVCDEQSKRLERGGGDVYRKRRHGTWLRRLHRKRSPRETVF